MPHAIYCCSCSWPIPLEGTPGALSLRCPQCGLIVEGMVYPALARPTGGASPEAAADTDASCFFHAQNRAVVPCDECGRFLCKLCELEVAGGRLCPECFNSGIRSRTNAQFEFSRTMHDTVALTLATLPAMFLWTIVISAPATLFWIAWHWKSPSSLVPRSKVRFYVAGIFAIGEIAAVVLLVAAIVRLQR